MDLGSNFLTLSVKLDDFTAEDILARYPKNIANKLLKSQSLVDEIITNNPSPDVSITIRHDWYLTKNKNTAAIAFKFSKDAEQAAVIVKEAKDMQKICPFSAKKCINLISGILKKEHINFVSSTATNPEKAHVFNQYHFGLFLDFYNIKNNPQLCYKYTIHQQNSNSYSQKVVDLIIEAIKKDPEHIIQNLRKELKKQVNPRSKGILST